MQRNGAMLLFWASVCALHGLHVASESSSSHPHSDVAQNLRGREGELEVFPSPKAAANKTHPLGVIADQAVIHQSNKIVNQTVVEKTEIENVTSSPPITNSTSSVPVSVDPVRTIDLSKPGVLKRAILVFGGFSLIAVVYFIFYRRSQVINIKNNVNHPSGGPQFRYGVLHSDDKPDRMELSNLPLTMDSDDDDEEDLEIFDLGEKKKSLSYTSLSSHDRKCAIDEIISSAGKSSSQEPTNDLLLDIEDSNTPAVIPVTSVHNYDI